MIEGTKTHNNKTDTINNQDTQNLDTVQDNIRKLKAIFPEVFTEGKINVNRLQEMFGCDILDDEEQYNFTWHGKRLAGKLAKIPSTGRLIPCKEESVNWDTTQNLFIEGDNLEVLKLLQKSYANKVKMIYIDPPYNTGNDFVYNDDFKDNIKNYLAITGQEKTNTNLEGRFHTNWLNMMYPRLKLARNLLRDDGVIFISIDDNEQANLKKLCDEVFGEENFVGSLSVENNPKGRKNSHFISVSHDYVVIYCKQKSNPESYFSENIPKNLSDLKKDNRGRLYTTGKRVLVGESSNNESVFDSPKHYSVYYNAANNDLITIKEETLEGINHGLINQGYQRYISSNGHAFIENTYTQTAFKNLFANGALIFKSSSIYEKDFNTVTRMKSMLVNDKNKGLDFKTETAGGQLKKLGIQGFTMPKNIGLLNTLRTLFEKKDYIVLDFFAGSGTTAHSTMQLNAIDGGARRFIMVQLPELCPKQSDAFKAGYKTIADIGKERIRRAAKKIKEENPLFSGDLGFKVFKLESHLTPQDNLIKTVDDTLIDLLLQYGFELSTSIETRTIDNNTVYIIDGGRLVVCLDDDIPIQTIISGIGVLKEELQPDTMRVVFKDSVFRDDALKTNAIQTLKRFGIFEVFFNGV